MFSKNPLLLVCLLLISLFTASVPADVTRPTFEEIAARARAAVQGEGDRVKQSVDLILTQRVLVMGLLDNCDQVAEQVKEQRREVARQQL